MPPFDIKQYYKDFSRLFGSGQVVRHRISNKVASPGDVGVPIGTARAFLKHVNNAYASTIASYGQYNRLARYCIAGDMLIPVPGKIGYMSVKELVDKFEAGEKIHTFAYDKENKKMVCVPVAKAWKTKVDEVWEVEFDNGTILKCTKDHRIMLRDGSYKEAQDLEEGTAVMPFNRKQFAWGKKKNTAGYKFIYSNSKWIPEHKIIVESLIRKVKNDEEIHHINFDCEDNNIFNLKILNAKEHRSFHAYINNKRFANPKEREKQSQIAKIRWAEGGDLRENVKEIVNKRLKSEGWKRQLKRLIDYNKTYKPGKHNANRTDQKGLQNANADRLFSFQTVCDAYRRGMSLATLAASLKCSEGKIKNRLKWEGYRNYTEFKQCYKNHKVISVRNTGKHEEVYDLTIDKYHNFAVGSPTNIGNYLIISNSDYNEMECLHPTTLVYTMEHGWTEIQELYKLYPNKNDKFHVYSYNHENNKVVIDEAFNVRPTKIDMTYKVNLDDGGFVIANSTHPFMLRDGTYKQVKDLKSGDALMPLLKAKFIKNREYVFVNILNGSRELNNRRWQREHSYVVQHFSNRCLKKSEVVHHKNFKADDNRIENLDILTEAEHRLYHAKINNEKKWSNLKWKKDFSKRHSEYMTKNNPAYRNDIKFVDIKNFCTKLSSEGALVSLCDICKNFDISNTLILNRLKQAGFKKFSDFIKSINSNWKHPGSENSGIKNPRYNHNLSFQSICNFYKSGTKLKELCKHFDVSDVCISNRLNKHGFKNWTDFKQNYNNHKIVSIEPYEKTWVYDLSTKKYHNFAICGNDSWIEKNNVRFNCGAVFVHNSMAEIGSALDIYADETCSKNEDGEILKITSPNIKIRNAVSTLLYDVLNLDFSLWNYIRNLCKYGDQFLLVDHHPDYGILNLLPLPVNEIEREEGYDDKNPLSYRYRWITQGNRVLENWQVIHFRLLANDNFLPYGSAILEPARRVWRQLILMEDAVMVYRIVRSPERRVFYIDVGNVAPQDIPAFVEKAKTQLKRNQIIDQDSGRVDMRYNPMPIHKDTPIPLLDGRTITIEEVAREHKKGKINWVYSIKDDNHQIVPGKIVWCGKNYTANKLVKVTLDDGGVVKTAPEHPFIMRDGTSKRADELEIDDALMPLYSKISDKANSYYGYERVYNPASSKFEFMHRIIANSVWDRKKNFIYENEVGNNRSKYAIVHHKNYNKLDNTPENLEWMGNVNHTNLHKSIIIKYNKSEKKRLKTIEDNKKYKKAQYMNKVYNGTELHKSHNKIRHEAQLKSWAKNKENRSKAMQWNIPDECIEMGKEIYVNNSKLNRDNFIEEFKKNRQIRSILVNANKNFNRPIDKLSRLAIERKLKEIGYKGFVDYKEDSLNSVGYRNHKVSNIEVINENVDVYCMTIEGPSGEQDRHNFGICSTNLEKEWSKSLFLKNSTDEDYFIPTRGEFSSRIETLAGGQFTGDIDDLTYIQNKLFAALKVPKSYLGYEQDIGSKATLCLRMNTKIPLLDGRTLELQDIIKEFKQGKKLSAYSIDTNTRRIIHGNIKWAGITQKNSSLMRLWLDNGKYLDCTPNHEIVLRNGKKVFASDLDIGDSVMPLYRRLSKKGYEEVYHLGEDKYEFTHKAVSLSSNSYIQGKVIHQKHIKETITEEVRCKNYEDPNHKVVKIEYLEEKEDVGCLTIDNEFHNFAVESGIFVGNSQEDVRFARTIQRIQNVVISELNKIAIIHLFSMGFKGEELVNFEITMANPSTIAEMQNLELWRNRFEVASVAAEGLFDRNFIYKKLWKLPDKDIEAIEEGKRQDRMFDLEVESIQSPDAIEASAPTAGELPAAPETTPPPAAGLPSPPGEAAPITAVKDNDDELVVDHDDPNAQVVGPNELMGVDKAKKKKKTSLTPDLYNVAFNLKKTGADFKRNKSELERFAKAPFGEDIDPEEKIFNSQVAKLKKFAEDLEKVGILRSARAKKKKKVLSE